LVEEAPAKVALDAPDSVIDALLDVELPEIDPERAAQDAAADLRAEEAAGEFSKDKKAAPAVVHSGEPLMSAEEATQRLGPKVMAALSEKFNGSLMDVRYPDENDMLF
jgi:hypothetical protein